MKAVVFGSTGFIGSHVAEQLALAGHTVTAAARETSDISFLESLNVKVERIRHDDPDAIHRLMSGIDVVYNCTADSSLGLERYSEELVEIKLTERLITAAGHCHVSRFVQLSTVVIYDFKSNQPLDEKYISQPEFPFQQLALEREKIVRSLGKKLGIETVILRPASAIGTRDKKSFFSRLYLAHLHNQFPMAGSGEARVSLVDTRDIGRAMEWLGTCALEEWDDGVYVLKGYDTTWSGLKEEMDKAIGTEAGVENMPISPSIMYKNLSTHRIWDDQKIKKSFHTLYTLPVSIKASLEELMAASAKSK
ncbi:NAD(P)-dependent oxidoreductase [Bacillus sp. FJAT-42376]|uniref:NAD-dependent epimerase/dehydratase family protein n=1 Tax=Bacillus sp. FJAT-42376 TaxID=2014076 RepID=UPI000F4F3C80|nr:NAD(P)-dependent oxidoreductase [Bacillus sp. FJAT-42376]AZB42040.1 NAD(P)-dependent oxidoreductase [Bacillus sp. FJAT-42376]